MQLEFILVTGANGAGKTSLIEINRALLEEAGFRIIIPDNILRDATSLTYSSAIIMEHIDSALLARSPFVLETPFQFDTLVVTLNRIRDAGYTMSMYQVFVKDEKQSAIRVKDRFQAGGLFINTDQVIANFKANLENIANYYSLFDHSYFIDNSMNRGMKLAAEFEKKKLMMFRSLNHPYLLNLFNLSAVNGKTQMEALRIIKKNQVYSANVVIQKKKGRQLKF